MVAASPCALAVAPLAYATAISSLASKVPSEFQSFKIFILCDSIPSLFLRDNSILSLLWIFILHPSVGRICSETTV
jgi:hypothetical protein